jgi:predicted permease
LGRGLLVAQVALSVAMVIGAGLLVRSLYLLQHTDLGVRTDGMVYVRTMAQPNARRGGDPTAYLSNLRDQLTALPGVASVSFSAQFPRSLLEPSMVPSFVGEPPSNAVATTDSVSPEHFANVGIRLLAGRLPTWADTVKTRRVAVVSESLARALASDGNVLERRVNLGTARDNQDVLIVGVVANATLGNPRAAAIPVMYFPVSQRGFGSPSIVIAMNGDPSSVAAGVRQVLQQGGRDYAQDIIQLDDHFARQPSTERMSATLAGALGVMAVLLALIGVYGTLAYSVSRRTREIGVRVAIGAAPSVVARSVLREAFVVTMVGLAIGLPLAYAGARMLKTLMFGVTESDPLTFAGVTLFFVLLGLGAAAIPARRAARVDPMIALRAE